MRKLISIITFPSQNKALVKHEDKHGIDYCTVPIADVDDIIIDYTYDIIKTGENLWYRNFNIRTIKND